MMRCSDNMEVMRGVYCVWETINEKSKSPILQSAVFYNNVTEIPPQSDRRPLKNVEPRNDKILMCLIRSV